MISDRPARLVARRGNTTAGLLTNEYVEFGVLVDDRNLTEAVEREMLDAEEILYERIRNARYSCPSQAQDPPVPPHKDD